MKKSKKVSMDDLYIDQNINGYRLTTSAYTPHGIKCMDSEYCHRILNIGRPVKAVLSIERNKHGYDYYNDYEPLDLSKDITSYYEKLKFVYDDEPLVIPQVSNSNPESLKERRNFDNSFGEDRTYSYTHPKYFVEYQGENPKLLEKEIKDNPHLHRMIKDNLLSNLKTYLNKK
jgi:hypothetical protein